MAAQLNRSSDGSPHRLVLPDRTDGPHGALLEVVRALEACLNSGLGQEDPQAPWQGPIQLDAGRWPLEAREIEEIDRLLISRGLELTVVSGEDPETLVAAAGLGLSAVTTITGAAPASQPPGQTAGAGCSDPNRSELRVHRGTLRSGDQLDVPGSLLLLGDVNPGASVRACGHVLVWGRLRGTAHAGCEGDRDARIVALQLRPLQLRIAGAVARGPEGVAPEGLAEEACLEDGVIQIRPASPSWPLSD